jgi:hypothetical protein
MKWQTGPSKESRPGGPGFEVAFPWNAGASPPLASKFEARNSNLETISKDQNPNDKTPFGTNQSQAAVWTVCVSVIGMLEF